MVRTVPELPKATQLVAGAGFTGVGFACALDEVGVVRCWGANNGGQLGVPSDRCPIVDKCATQAGCIVRCDKPLVVEGLPPVAELAAGHEFMCARTTQGEIYCWGRGGPQLRGESGLDPKLRLLEL